MATVPYSEIASSFLQKAGAPDTPEMRKAVEAWVRQESGGTIYSNNPWNIHDDVARDIGVRTCGKRTTLDGSETVAVFCSLDEGIAASVKLLNAPFGPQNGYDKVVIAAKSGDPIAFLDSLARSKWAGSRYGGPGAGNNLIRNYRAIGGTAVATVKDIGGDAVNAATTAFPVGSLAAVLGRDGTLTLADVQPIAKEIAAITAKIPGWPGGGERWEDIAAYLVDFVGHKYSTIGLNAINPGKLFQTPGGAPGEGSERSPGLLDIPQFLLDPANWLRILTLFAGIGILGYGTIVTMRGMQKAPIPTPV